MEHKGAGQSRLLPDGTDAPTQQRAVWRPGGWHGCLHWYQGGRGDRGQEPCSQDPTPNTTKNQSINKNYIKKEECPVGVSEHGQDFHTRLLDVWQGGGFSPSDSGPGVPCSECGGRENLRWRESTEQWPRLWRAELEKQAQGVCVVCEGEDVNLSSSLPAVGGVLWTLNF